MKTPVLFIIFNRPETTKKVFESIRQAKPQKLFIAADGPRENKAKEEELCEETRKIATMIDWPCETRTLFREKNLGCGKAVSEAITWFFENVEEGIILEDDCLPDQSFFHFCSELLERYRLNDKIFMISGDNFLPKSLKPKESYYFSKIAHIWGWATWKRAWREYDFKMRDFPIFLENKTIEKIWTQKENQKYWLERFYEVTNGQIDTWDHQWTYTIWKNQGFSVAPSVNLISNIGFGSKGTHTTNPNDISSNLPREEMKFPLTINSTITQYSLGDKYENKLSLPKGQIFKRILKKFGLFNIVKYIYLSIKK
ncbi:MAG: nucleotide-diphospho-sugar transferase [bacterium]